MTDSSPAASATRRRAARRIGLAALAAGLVLAASACSGDDTDGDAGADAEVDELNAELDAAVERAETAEAEVEQLTAELEALGDVDAEEVARLEAELTQAEADLAAAQAEIEELTVRAETAEARVAEVEEIVGQFPIALDSSVIPEDMPGTYRIDFQEAYCAGFATCGTPPVPTNATIYFTDEQFLRVGVTGILDAGLFSLDGSLYGITDSTTALPPCAGVPRPVRVTITIYAGSISVREDGTRVVNDLNASITFDAPDEGPDCPGGLAFYASSLTPVS